MATHALLLKDIINQTLQMCLDYMGVGYIAGRTWTRAQVIIAINQALMDWCRRTGFLRKEDTVDLTEDIKTYTFPDDCLQLLGIAFYDGNARAWISGPTAISNRDITGFEITGSSVPTRFFLQFLNYDKFGFQPNVGDDYTAYLTFARSHVYLSDEDTYPEDAIPPWFHKDIKFGAAEILLAEIKDSRRWKKDYAGVRWNAVCNRMRGIKAYRGPEKGMYAL
jgi:hypothetical protein